MAREGTLTLCKYLLVMVVLLVSLVSSGCVSARTPCPQVDPSQKVYAASVYGDAVVAFENSSDPNNPIDLVLYRGVGSCSRTVVDKYSVEGSAPAVTAVFPYTVKGQPNLFIIVAWEINSRGVGTYGKLYQVYAYGKDGKGGLASSKLIADSDEMTGMEGTADGESSHFQGKNAIEVKRLLERLHLE